VTAIQVVIAGGGGQLGRELARARWPASFTLRALSRAELDIAEPSAVASAVASAELVINAAAYTAVDKAESETAAALRVNRDGPALLARACAERGAPLLHVSTDYVFDGTKSGAYTETDPISPLGVYGASKAEGEATVRERCAQHIILRTSWVVSAFGQNFVKTMLRLCRERDTLRVVADQIGRPTPAKDLARALVAIASRYAAGTPIGWGTYHFAGRGEASWHALATEVAQLQQPFTGRRPTVDPISTADYPTPARRPPNSVLDTSKLERALELEPARWQHGVEDIVRELLSAPAPSA
jgi:dTDP-4-dehydrorhamnose reductase